MEQLEVFLVKVSALKKEKDLIDRITGSNFNIFRILRVDSEEVRTHSAFIGELLNPKGSHGQKDLFLRLFLKQLGLEELDTSNASIEIEKHIGFKKDVSDWGGRIDILINLHDFRTPPIVIENKIYAGDGHNQLKGYHQANPDSKIIYLTLFGKEPDMHSTEGLASISPLLSCISYQDDIVNWLQKCREQVLDIPVLKEAIGQYQNLIMHLTNNPTRKMEYEKFRELVEQNPQNLEAVFYVERNLRKLKQGFFEILNGQLEELAKSKGLDFSPFSEDFDTESYYSCHFTNEALKAFDLELTFEFQVKPMRNLAFGFYKAQEDKKMGLVLKESFDKIFKRKSLQSKTWPCYLFWFEMPNWGEKEFKLILDGSMKNRFSEKIDGCLKALEQADLSTKGL